MLVVCVLESAGHLYRNVSGLARAMVYINFNQLGLFEAVADEPAVELLQ